MAALGPKVVKVHHPATKEEFLYPNHYGQKDFESALSYEAKPTDVFVCSYNKCGTTWLQNIVWLIIHNGEEISRKIRDSIPFLELDGAEAATNIDDSEYPRIIKTHLPHKWVPYHSKAKYFYITRNPKDALVSYHFHVLGFHQYLVDDGFTLKDMFDLFIKGQTMLSGDYFDHVIKWNAKRDDQNVLFLLYEDLKKDTRGMILKIATFLGGKYKENLMKDGNLLLERIINLTSFKKMKSETEKWCNQSRPSDLPFIRKGEVGDWRNYLTKEQSETLDRMLVEKGKESGVDQLWKEYPDLI